MIGQNLQHVVEFVNTDEFVFPMDIVNAGKTAQSLAITLRTETDHDNFLSSMRRTFLAEGLIFVKAHL